MRCSELLENSHYQDINSQIRLPSITEYVYTIQSCINQCSLLSYCISWAYSIEDGYCALFARKGPIFDSPGIYGGACHRTQSKKRTIFFYHVIFA